MNCSDKPVFFQTKAVTCLLSFEFLKSYPILPHYKNIHYLDLDTIAFFLTLTKPELQCKGMDYTLYLSAWRQTAKLNMHCNIYYYQ